jgi:hypothetical protein
MAIEEGKMLQAVYDAMFDALTTNPTGIGGRPALPRATTYMSLLIPGNPVDATQFADAWSPDNPDGSTRASENFAVLVDTVPTMSPGYQDSGQSIETLYREIIRANVAPPPPDPAGQEAFDRANKVLFVDGTDYDDNGNPITVPVPSPLYFNYLRKRKAYDDALASYTGGYLMYDLSNPAEARKWSIMGPVLQRPLDQAWADLQGARPGVVESALATIGQYQQSNVARLFSEARQLFDQTQRLGSDGFPFHICEAFPANWFASSAAGNFTQITIQSQRVRLSEDSRFTSYRASGGVNLGLWRVGGGVSGQSQQFNMSSDTSNMMVSFRFGRVEIRRRWLNPSLFSLRGWSTAGRSPGAYSNGNSSDNSGIFPLLTTSFIVARDLKISASWSHTDLQTASKSINASASVGWGPFSLSGSYSNSSSSRRFNSSFDGTTITMSGMQIVAWLSTIVPFCPPTGGPPAQPTVEPAVIGVQRKNPYARLYAAPVPVLDYEEMLTRDGQRGRRPRVPSEPMPTPEPALRSEFTSMEPVTSALSEPARAPAEGNDTFESAES